MLKKIALLIMLVLPMGVFAQSTLKFGHMNSTDIIPTMPEYTKAISELQALEKNYTDEIQRTHFVISNDSDCFHNFALL